MVEINAETLKPVIIWLRGYKQVPTSPDSRVPSKFVLISEVDEHIQAALKESGGSDPIEQAIIEKSRNWLYFNGDLEVPSKDEEVRLGLRREAYAEIG